MCWFRPTSLGLCKRGRWGTCTVECFTQVKKDKGGITLSMSWRMSWKVDKRAVTACGFPRAKPPLGSREKLDHQFCSRLIWVFTVANFLHDGYSQNVFYRPLEISDLKRIKTKAVQATIGALVSSFRTRTPPTRSQLQPSYNHKQPQYSHHTESLLRYVAY